MSYTVVQEYAMMIVQSHTFVTEPAMFGS